MRRRVGREAVVGIVLLAMSLGVGCLWRERGDERVYVVDHHGDGHRDHPREERRDPERR